MHRIEAMGANLPAAQGSGNRLGRMHLEPAGHGVHVTAPAAAA